MPVEIRELVIRAIAESETAGSGEGQEFKPDVGVTPAIERETIVQECVRLVLQILKRKEER